ncbi:hypothetical protein FKM82_027934 [Ascaphus truei]
MGHHQRTTSSESLAIYNVHECISVLLHPFFSPVHIIHRCKALGKDCCVSEKGFSCPLSPHRAVFILLPLSRGVIQLGPEIIGH